MSLVGWWKLDGNLEDSSGNGYTMSTSGSGMSYTTGKVTSQCEAFTGNGYLISSGVPDNIKKVAPVTMMAWIKTSGLSGSNTQNGIIALNYSRSLYLNTGNKLTAKTLGQNIGNSVNLADGIWHHVAMTDTTTNVRLYLDGIKVGEIDYTPVATTYTNGVVIGTELNNSIYKFTGSINDVRLYDEALSDEEIYNISKGLVVHYTFGNDNGNTVYDNSGYGNNGVIITATAPTWTNDSPKGVGAYSFSGSSQYITSDDTLGSLWSNNFTISMWVYRKDSTRSILLGEYNKGTRVNFELNTNGTVRFYWDGSPDYTSSVIVPLNTWCLVSMTREGNTAKFYLNGMFTDIYSGTITDKIGTTSFRLGDDFRGSTDVSFMGTIADFRIYATSLSASDIKSLYTSTIITTDNGSIKTLSEFNELDIINLPNNTSYITANGQGTAYLKTKKIYPLQLGRDSINIPSRNYQVLTWTYGTITDASGGWKLFTTSGTGGFPYYEYSNSGVPNNFVVGELYFASVELKNISSDTVSFYTQGNGLQGNSGNISFASNESKRVSFIGTFVAHNAQIQMHSSTDLVAFQFKKPMMISITALLTTLGDSFIDILSNAGYITNAQIAAWCDTLPWIDPDIPLVLGQNQSITNLVNGGWSSSEWGGDSGAYEEVSSGGLDNDKYFRLTKTASGSGGCYFDFWLKSSPMSGKYFWKSSMRTSESSLSMNGYQFSLNSGNSNIYNNVDSKTLTTSWEIVSNFLTPNYWTSDTMYNLRCIVYNDLSSSFTVDWTHIVTINSTESGLYSFILLQNVGTTDTIINSWINLYLKYGAGTATLGSLLSISALSCYNSSAFLLPMPRLTSSKRYTSALNFNENALFDGLVAYYPLNGNSNDYSGNGNNGTINGASIGTGKNQQCYSFNGTSDYITASPPSNGQTLSFFCNLISNNDSDDVPLIYGTTSSGKNLMIYFRSSSSTVRIFGWGLDTYTGFTKDLNTWHLWTITSTGTEVYLYRDGIADNLNPYSASISITDNSLIIGRGNINTYSNCLIQDVRIYNRALTAQEIKIMYEVTFNRKPMITNIGVFAPKFSEV